MKAITLTQPWASLMAVGAKRIETRSWRTNYRGDLAIHSAKSFPTDCRALLCFPHFRQALGDVADLPLGSILAVVTLADCLPSDLGVMHNAGEQLFGNYAPGRFCFMTTNLRRLKRPVQGVIGHLGIWNVPLPLQAEIAVGL